MKIEVEAPAVLHQNELEDAQVKAIEAQNGVLSPQTWCAETGRDYDIESANMMEHQAQFGMPGMGLDPNDPEGGGGQGGPPGGPGKPPGANGQPPKPKSTSDYVKESADWDEDKHPRRDDGEFGSGGGKFQGSHGYSHDEIDAMSPPQRKALAGLGGKVKTKGMSDDAIKGVLKDASPLAKAPVTQKMLPHQHKAALDDLLKTVVKGREKSSLDPRGDLKHLPAGGEEKSAVLKAVADHFERTKAGIPVDKLHAQIGGDLSPEQFRAVLIDAHDKGEVSLGGWARMADDLPRPDLAPVVTDKIMGYVHPAPPKSK